MSVSLRCAATAFFSAMWSKLSRDNGSSLTLPILQEPRLVCDSFATRAKGSCFAFSWFSLKLPSAFCRFKSKPLSLVEELSAFSATLRVVAGFRSDADVEHTTASEEYGRGYGLVRGKIGVSAHERLASCNFVRFISREAEQQINEVKQNPERYRRWFLPAPVSRSCSNSFSARRASSPADRPPAKINEFNRSTEKRNYLF